MTSKADEVRERIRSRTRKRRSSTRVVERSPKSYKVVAVSLYADQADTVDWATRDLLDAGYRRASRSLVVQAAIERLREELNGKSKPEMLRYFIEREARRSLARMESRPRFRREAQPQQLLLPNISR